MRGRRSKLLPVFRLARRRGVQAHQAGFPSIAAEGLIGLFSPRGMNLGLRDRIAADVVAAIA